MKYCHTCDWKHEHQNCPIHGHERNPNGTLKSDLSKEDKEIIIRVREREIRKLKI